MQKSTAYYTEGERMGRRKDIAQYNVHECHRDVSTLRYCKLYHLYSQPHYCNTTVVWCIAHRACRVQLGASVQVGYK